MDNKIERKSRGERYRVHWVTQVDVSPWAAGHADFIILSPLFKEQDIAMYRHSEDRLNKRVRVAYNPISNNKNIAQPQLYIISATPHFQTVSKRGSRQGQSADRLCRARSHRLS